MKKKSLVLVIILMLLVTGGLFIKKGRIRGVVKDQDGHPIQSAKVKPECQEDQGVDGEEVLTDKDGEYITEELTNALYLLKVTKEGYVQYEKSLSLNFSLVSNGDGFNCSNEITLDVTLDEVETAEEGAVATKIVVTAVPTSISANGSSTSLVTASVCDEDSLVITTSTSTVTFSITGVGSIIGSSSKIASLGIATVMLQSTSTEGTMTITATSIGLSAGTVSVVTTAIPVKIISTAAPTSMAANGSSTSLVTASICDSGNSIVATATNQITFSISGKGSLIGTTSKIASNGIATIILQSENDIVGIATVTAISNGLTTGAVGITMEIPYDLVLIASYDAPCSTIRGLAWDGTRIWSVGDITNKIYKHNMDGTLSVSANYNCSLNSTGLAWNGSTLWRCIGGTVSSDNIIKHNMDGALSIAATYEGPFPPAQGIGHPRGLTWDGSNMWSCDLNSDNIYKHNMDGTLSVASTYLNPVGFMYNPSGLAWDGSNIWSCSAQHTKLYKHKMDSSLTVLYSISFLTAPHGLLIDSNGYLWCSDPSPGTQKIYKYQLQPK